MGPLPSLELADEVCRHMGQRLREARRERHLRRSGDDDRLRRGAHGRRHAVAQSLLMGLQRAVATGLGRARIGAPGPAEAAASEWPAERDNRFALCRRSAHVLRRRRQIVRVGRQLRRPDRPRPPSSLWRAPARHLDGVRALRVGVVRQAFDSSHRRVWTERFFVGLTARLAAAANYRRQRGRGRGPGLRGGVSGVIPPRWSGEAARCVRRLVRESRRGARVAGRLQLAQGLGLQRLRPGDRQDRPQLRRHRAPGARPPGRLLRPDCPVPHRRRRRRRDHHAPRLRAALVMLCFFFFESRTLWSSCRRRQLLLLLLLL
mmetsp:Transcript_19333/g.60827  ORF Transcript_19333/g.60827 Transcript_19333/m.60827 type:complete len:318 (-) Transcript_19333:85-1038(-)